ncbi:hypothetical protein C0J52_08484 [Blattella germanica]|nr:hypothetical protein C0J52_08484 [Blattella germanica]
MDDQCGSLTVCVPHRTAKKSALATIIHKCKSWLSGLRQCALVPDHGTRAGLSPRGGRNFLMDFGQCMGQVPTQHREESGELRLVVDSGYGY